MENVGIYLFGLIVLVWPAVSYLFAANISTSQFGTAHDYSPVARHTNPSVTVAPTPTYAKTNAQTTNPIPTAEPQNRMS
jgi:hypothetical protein